MEGMGILNIISQYRGKRVFVTGHTGFKGAWMCRLLALLGAEVTGYSLDPPTDPNLYGLAGIGEGLRSIHGDIRDLPALKEAVGQGRPEIVIHLAAQPLVRESYRAPVATYETNVMGTVHLLEACRCCGSVRSIVNVTTDKVYRNEEWEWGYRETDRLNGFDPYSNSKSCSELVTSSYQNSFLQGISVSTCRAGNVIGGGDFAADRILPDCLRAAIRGETIPVRNPGSVRPYQHVLEPVTAYLYVAIRQLEDPSLQGSYNIGPREGDCLTTGELVALFCQKWGEGMAWSARTEQDAPHEAGFLKLDCSRVKARLGWEPRWGIAEAVEKTVEWGKAYQRGGNLSELMGEQIKEYLEERDHV